MLDTRARQVLRQRAAHGSMGFRVGSLRQRHRCCRDLKLFEPELQLVDLAIELLRAATELQAPELRDHELQVLDFGATCKHQRLQRINIVGKGLVRGAHDRKSN